LLTVESTRLHHLLLSYIRLLTADPEIASRNDWSLEPLHTLRTQHANLGVRLLAIQALSKQRKWSEIKRMKMEEENVGAVDKVDVPISFGWEIVKSENGGTDIRELLVDGWLLALTEAKRIEQGTSRERHVRSMLISSAKVRDSGAGVCAVALDPFGAGFLAPACHRRGLVITP
jgi:hypothetical protein